MLQSGDTPMTMPATTSSTVLERTKALLPQLRDGALANEQARRVLPDTFDALSRAGIFRMTAPKDAVRGARRGGARVPVRVVGFHHLQRDDVAGRHVL